MPSGVESVLANPFVASLLMLLRRISFPIAIITSRKATKLETRTDFD